jgi:hypothetical protein
LPLGKGSNPGAILQNNSPPVKTTPQAASFDATRRGMVETLAFQAEAHLSDLLGVGAGACRPRGAGGRRRDPAWPRSSWTTWHSTHGWPWNAAACCTGCRFGIRPPFLLGDEVYGFPLYRPAAFDPDGPRIADAARIL